MENTHFYVYAHLRKDGTIFYVGKGTGNRAYRRQHRSKWWRDTARKDYGEEFPDTVILHDRLDERTALDLEVFEIALRGRKNVDVGGKLVNVTAGGEGTVGYIHSEDARRRMSDAKRGDKHPNWGKPRDPRIRARQSASLKGKYTGADSKMYGRKPSADTLAKMSAAQKGRRLPEGTGDVFSARRVKNVDLRSPDGTLFTVANRKTFADTHGLDHSHVSKLTRGLLTQHRGWTVAA